MKYKKAFPLRGRGTAPAVDEGLVMHIWERSEYKKYVYLSGGIIMLSTILLCNYSIR
jgi:hypothetical protein